MIYGLKINMEKSELPLVGREDNLELASKLGCWVGKFPFAYLSLPLGALFKPTTMWDVVEEKFQKRFALWRRQYFLKEGCPS